MLVFFTNLFGGFEIENFLCVREKTRYLDSEKRFIVPPYYPLTCACVWKFQNEKFSSKQKGSIFLMRKFSSKEKGSAH